MKICFVSNYFNHHQKPLSDALFQLTNGEYIFFETMPMEDERKRMGWDSIQYPNYVKKTYENKEQKKYCVQSIIAADIVICGSAPNALIAERLKRNKLVFRYSERLFKEKNPSKLELIIRKILYKYRNKGSKNVYLLCAGAYVAEDYMKISNMYKGKMFNWGYFPPAIKYDNPQLLLNSKKPNSILWCGRLIEWKHPEKAIYVAKYLKQRGVEFSLNIIGTGEMSSQLMQMIRKEKLESQVKLLNALPPQEIRKHMESSQIAIITSDRNEGWGAVVNEAMNSCCAVVASNEIGAVPFLIKNDVNGSIYFNNDTEQLSKKVWQLLSDREYRNRLAINAYSTISTIWNAENAADKFLMLGQSILSKQEALFIDGPCSAVEMRG